MYRYLLVCLPVFFITKMASAQHSDSTVIFHTSPLISSHSAPTVYNVKLLLDGSIAAAATAWTLYGFSVIYNRDTVSYAELNALDRKNVNRLDRGTTLNYDKKAKAASDKFFYGSMPLPLLLLIDKKIRHDAGRIGLLYLETIATTGTIYTIAAMSANRFRPYAYNKDLPLGTRAYGGARNSFFAGHPAIVGTSTFFMASVYSAYHPEMKNKWVLYGIAGAATATTALLRVKAGQHFPTDVMVGCIVGPTIGILVPHFHLNKNNNARLSITPQAGFGMNGFCMRYKL